MPYTVRATYIIVQYTIMYLLMLLIKINKFENNNNDKITIRGVNASEHD